MNIDFLTLLLIASFITGIITLADTFYFARKRQLIAVKIPWYIEYSRSLFPVFVIVLIIRAFLIQFYFVPTGSLEPTILPGDLIVANMYAYGLRLPTIHRKIINIDEPKKGDIIIFRWPVNSHKNLIKRVVGVPGDKISYIDKKLYINGKLQPLKYLHNGTATFKQRRLKAVELQEKLAGKKHDIFLLPYIASTNLYNLKVPKGYYFVMGDNRDLSEDSRYWGFVPEQNIIAKGMRIVFSWDKQHYHIRWQRFGKKIN